MKRYSYVPHHLTETLARRKLARSEELVVSHAFVDKTRIDRYLAGRFPDRSRSFFQSLARQKRIRVGGKPVPSSYRVKPHDAITFPLPQTERPRPGP